MSTQPERDLAEYQQLLEYLSTTQQTQVLAPIDGEGREFWVHAQADPTKEIEIEIDGKTRTYNQEEALNVVKKKVKQLEKEVNSVVNK
ncbi:CYFA0S38e00276g1_1 [Cyberlindnera fabianii]|uniref:CYFA0S38e00276g1_1 n=1 Tax=Cyberlindnera fabianii TaxID=36022 RepID=A0A061BCY0_CYBFA|nr:CYFA0S38e00276g1_1 [Cyberlindnera fabianii]